MASVIFSDANPHFDTVTTKFKTPNEKFAGAKDESKQKVKDPLEPKKVKKLKKKKEFTQASPRKALLLRKQMEASDQLEGYKEIDEVFMPTKKPLTNWRVIKRLMKYLCR